MKDLDIQKLGLAFIIGSSLGGVGGHTVGSADLIESCAPLIQHALQHTETKHRLKRLEERD